MRLGRRVGLKRVCIKALGKIVVAGLCFSLVTSCGQGEDGPTVLGPPPLASVPQLIGDVLYRADGSEVGIDAVESNPIIGIYFAAGWCPACAGFTPLLISAYEELEQAGKPFEVVFVSSDGSSEDMFAHMTDRGMPWLALPFDGLKANALKLRYGVNAIPTLVVIDDEGSTITMDGRIDVAQKGAQAYDDWLAH
jgi:nucleoredoxin